MNGWDVSKSENMHARSALESYYHEYGSDENVAQ